MNKYLVGFVALSILVVWLTWPPPYPPSKDGLIDVIVGTECCSP